MACARFSLAVITPLWARTHEGVSFRHIGQK
jgi:hypothetical protein